MTLEHSVFYKMSSYPYKVIIGQLWLILLHVSLAWADFRLLRVVLNKLRGWKSAKPNAWQFYVQTVILNTICTVLENLDSSQNIIYFAFTHLFQL